MMLRQYFVKAIFFWLLTSSAVTALADNESAEKAVRQTVESYCKIEFSGGWIEDRWAIIKFGSKRKAEVKIGKYTYENIFQIKHYPFVVVSSYDLREVHLLSSNRATAKVVYNRLAHSEIKDRKDWYLVADRQDNESVTLNLVYDKNKWWVLDPPPPRISKQTLVHHYETKIKELAVEDDPRWQRERDIVKLLKSLANADNENTALAARHAVKNFCEEESDGGRIEEWDMVKFGSNHKTEDKRETRPEGSMLLIRRYPFIVINSYDIQDVQLLSPDRATAKVAYNRVAHSENKTGQDWNLVADRQDNETVTLNLVFDKNKWWVIDPPTPRIAKQTLIEEYEMEIKALQEDGGWLSQPGQFPKTKALFDKDVENLRILKSLP